MTYQLLDAKPSQEPEPTKAWPGDEATQNLLAELEGREMAIGQPFHLERLDPKRHHVALCVGKTEINAVFCIPPPSGLGPALYLWVPLENVVTCNGFFKWASPHLPINPNAGQLVPPLVKGTQYWIKRATPEADRMKGTQEPDRVLLEDAWEIDRMLREYQARFATLKPNKSKPEEMETPTLKPLAAKRKGKKEEASPGPGL
jgi:hypothetical protein